MIFGWGWPLVSMIIVEAAKSQIERDSKLKGKIMKKGKKPPKPKY